MEKRVTLEKFRRFVFPEDQDYWMYQDPPEEYIKLAKDISKIERKYGNMQFPKSNDDNNSADQ